MSTFDPLGLLGEIQQPTVEWEEWSPRGLPHVKGRYEKRQFKDGLPQVQHFEVSCQTCGAKWGGPCLTGAVRTHIAAFGVKHVHADPLAAPKVERPGSLRRTRVDGEYPDEEG